MPVLANVYHERFAQELAFGKHSSQGVAYIAAGYDCQPNSSETLAHRLLKKVPEIRGRVVELQEQVVKDVAVTLHSLIREADEIQRAAKESNQMAAAVSALTAKAKLAGLWVDRKETGAPGEFADLDTMTADELRAYVAPATPSPDDQDETRH